MLNENRAENEVAKTARIADAKAILPCRFYDFLFPFVKTNFVHEKKASNLYLRSHCWRPLMCAQIFFHTSFYTTKQHCSRFATVDLYLVFSRLSCRRMEIFYIYYLENNWAQGGHDCKYVDEEASIFNGLLLSGTGTTKTIMSGGSWQDIHIGVPGTTRSLKPVTSFNDNGAGQSYIKNLNLFISTATASGSFGLFAFVVYNLGSV